jgi:hypothetical protein
MSSLMKHIVYFQWKNAAFDEIENIKLSELVEEIPAFMSVCLQQYHIARQTGKKSIWEICTPCCANELKISSEEKCSLRQNTKISNSLEENIKQFLGDSEWCESDTTIANKVYLEDINDAIKRRNIENKIDHIETKGLNKYEIFKTLGYKVVRDNQCAGCSELPNQCTCLSKNSKRKCGPRYIQGIKIIK